MDQAIDRFLLSCRVEGKSYGTIECYTDRNGQVNSVSADFGRGLPMYEDHLAAMGLRNS